MKYREVVTDILKNPTKVFTSSSTGRTYTIGADELGFLYATIDSHIVISEEIFIANVRADDLDWQLVPQPVTWQEAIQAWHDGKVVTVITTYQKYVFSPIEKMEVWPTMIQDGTWYVED